MGKRHMFCGDCGSTNLSAYFPTPESVAHTVLHHAKVLSDYPGGSHVAMQRLNAAMEEAKNLLT